MFPPERYYGMHFVSGGVSRDFLILPPRLLSALTGNGCENDDLDFYLFWLPRPPPDTAST